MVILKLYTLSKEKGVKQDITKSIEYYERSAKRGNSSALYRLGLLHLNGQGVKRDNSKTAKYFLKSAERGNSNLGEKNT